MGSLSPGEAVTIKRSKGFWYEYNPAQDTKIRTGKTVVFASNLDINCSVHELDRSTGRICIKLGPKALSKCEGQFPPPVGSLILHEYFRKEPMATAVYEVAKKLYETGRLSEALRTFFTRSPPKLRGRNGGPLIASTNTDVLTATTDCILDMDGTMLPHEQ